MQSSILILIVNFLSFQGISILIVSQVNGDIHVQQKGPSELQNSNEIDNSEIETDISDPTTNQETFQQNSHTDQGFDKDNATSENQLELTTRMNSCGRGRTCMKSCRMRCVRNQNAHAETCKKVGDQCPNLECCTAGYCNDDYKCVDCIQVDKTGCKYNSECCENLSCCAGAKGKICKASCS